MESGERCSIRDSVRSLKKYGSTCNHVRNLTNDALVRYDVVSGDTLQGIALKYGVTTEQIRRANRLYASDSLFSKPFLMIPVPKGSPFYPKEPQTAPAVAPFEPMRPLSYNDNTNGAWDPLQGPLAGPSSSFSMDFPSSSSSASCSTAIPGPPPGGDRPEELSPEEEQRKDLDELLGKIDSTIANSRRFVAKSQDSTDFAGDGVEERTHGTDGYVGDYEGAYQNAYSGGGHARNSSGSFHTDDTSGLITNSRQVKNSLQRLERTQDELFEL